MPNSISVILPVRNAEFEIVERLEQLLEMLPDFAHEFEILVIDDGSDDLTADLALEFCQAYPQVRMISRMQSQGLSAAIEMGMARTHGDFVFVGEINSPISAADVRQLWEMRHDADLVLAKAIIQPKPISDRLMNRLTAWGDALKRNNAQLEASDPSQVGQALASLQMIRRSAIESLTRVADPEHQISVQRDARTSTVRMSSRADLPTRTIRGNAPTPVMSPIAPR